jgi:DNA polymerase-1
MPSPINSTKPKGILIKKTTGDGGDGILHHYSKRPMTTIKEAIDHLNQCKTFTELEASWRRNVGAWSATFGEEEAQPLIILKNHLKGTLPHSIPAESAPTVIHNEEGLRYLRTFLEQEKPKHLFVDTETSGLDPFSDDLILVTVMGKGRVFVITHLGEDTVALTKRLLEDAAITKIFHNGKFDIKFLEQKIFPGEKLRIQNLFDTYLAEQILGAGISSKGDFSLQALAKKYLGCDLDKSEQVGFGQGDLSPAQLEYAANDTRVLEPIFRKQSEALARAGLVNVALLEFSIAPAVAEIELAGMLIDTKKLESMTEEYEKRVLALSDQLKGLVGGNEINFRSWVQVKEVLAGFGFQVESTAVDTISRIDHPFAKGLVEHRRVSKLLNSFIDALPWHINEHTGRIHPEFFQLGTETGRFTCQKPNLQQIPKEQCWRDLFVARQGYLILTADYSQIELRILAEYSQDPAFLEAYRTGQDLHSQTAAAMFRVPPNKVDKTMRNIAKTINFGLCYGMTAQGLAARQNIPIEQAENFISAYFRSYPKVKGTLQDLGMKAVMKHFSETLLGRKRYFIPRGDYKAIERKGRNTPIQGTCGDIVKKAIQYLHSDLFPFDARIINLVHDELVIEVREDQADTVKSVVERAMVRAGEDFLKCVPVEVEITIDRVWRK